MKQVNVEKFLAAYEDAVKGRDDLIVKKDEAVKSETEKVEAIIGANFSETVKAHVLAEVIAEKEKEFDLAAADDKVASFEEYIIFVEDAEEHPADCQCDECVAAREGTEVAVDEYGNPIA